MTKIAQNNIQADGIGDIFEDVFNQGGRNSAVDIGTVDTYQDRAPKLNGSTRSGRQPQGAIQYNDFKSSFKVAGGFTTWSEVAGKNSISHTMVGWATTGGMQAATDNETTTQIGTLFDGDVSYTTSAKPFSQLNSNFDGNKWISAIVSDTFTTGLLGPSTTHLYICFEGGGASTSDTDWSTLNFKKDGTVSTNFIDYSADGGGGSFARTGVDSGYPLVRFSRVVYRWTVGLGGAPTDRELPNSNGFAVWNQFE